MKRMPWLFCILAGWLLASVAAAHPWNVMCRYDNRVELVNNGETIATAAPVFFDPSWRSGRITKCVFNPKEMEIKETTAVQGNVHFTARLEAEGVNGETVRLRYALSVNEPVELNAFGVNFQFNNRFLFGGSYQIGDGVEQPFPLEKSEKTLLCREVMSDLTLRTVSGVISFHLLEPQRVTIQDERQWNTPVVSVRIELSSGDGKRWKAGQTGTVDMELSSLDGVALEKPALCTIRAGEDWIPLDAVMGVVPGSALDFSTMGFCDAPAGKHGRVIAKDGHFEFENLPGKPQRFYGVNLVGNSQMISHLEAEKLAERLWRLGYNSVRFHHHDGLLADRESVGATGLNAGNMDKLDYLFAELKKRGIYCTTDLYVSRTIDRKDLWPEEEGRLNFYTYKNLLPFNEKVWENWKAFSRNFLLHVNPYTGMSYAEDPAMSWICMVNEATYDIWGLDRLNELSRKAWTQGWNAWLLKKYGNWQERNRAHHVERPETIELLPKSTEMNAAELADFHQFVLETEQRLFGAMKAFVQEELGCKALFTSMNFRGLEPLSPLARKDLDFVDNHFYVDHPRFPSGTWGLPAVIPNQSVVRNGNVGGCREAVSRIFGKPFTISEFNYSAPGRYRGIGGILTGCVGALQDWNSVWRFAYAHANDCLFKPTVLKHFDMARDPLSQAADRASLCLFLRQDMKPLKNRIAMTVNQAANGREALRNPVDTLKAMALQTQVGVAFEDTAPNLSLSVAMADDAPQASAHIGTDVPTDKLHEMIHNLLQGNELQNSDTPLQTPGGQLTLLPQQDTMILDTERTAGGFGPAGTHIETHALDVDIMGTTATVWASSLDGLPLKQSRHILLTHLTDLQDSEMVYAEAERQTLLSWGELPYLVRNGQARLLLKIPQGQTVTVWALKTNGERMETLPVVQKAEGMELTLSVKGTHGAQMLYEVQVTQP